MTDQQATSDNQTVPIVDFSPMFSPNLSRHHRKAVGEAIFRAFRDVGFVYLSNYLPPESSTAAGLHFPTKQDIETAFSFSHKFFTLPLADKMKSPHPPQGWWHRGYSSIGREKVNQYSNPTPSDDTKQREIREIKESFEAGRENDPLLTNIWPPEKTDPNLRSILGFRAFYVGFYDKCHNLGQLILSSLAIGIGVDSDSDHVRGSEASQNDGGFFAKYHVGKANQLRLLHYPEIDLSTLVMKGRKSDAGREGSREGGEDDVEYQYERISSHTDLGTITLLFQEDEAGVSTKNENTIIAGLEVENPHQPGQYISAPSMSGKILVNIGDMLQRWSNDVLRSTRHRVRVPLNFEDGTIRKGNDAIKVKARYSLVYFVAPDQGTIIRGIEALGGERKYEDIEAYEYILSGMNKAY